MFFMVITYLNKSLQSQFLNKPLHEQNLFALIVTERKKNWEQTYTQMMLLLANVFTLIIRLNIAKPLLCWAIQNEASHNCMRKLNYLSRN